MKERIQKVLSNLGIMSRREAERYIKAGKVILNGKKATPGDKVDISKDNLIVDKKPVKNIHIQKYYIINKPAGYLCTHNDPEGRKTIFDLIKEKLFISYVGRLDYNSEGLVLLTNDGELKQYLSRPVNKVEREYKVKVSKNVSHEDIPELMKPVIIDNRKVTPERINIIKNTKKNAWISIVVTEGINREIRKFCELKGLLVSRLIRVRFGPIKLIGVSKGGYRELTYNEVKSLKKMMGERG
ncbi:MAG: pseudouridine synthase [Candidatus Muiribacteriota bacterium]